MTGSYAQQCDNEECGETFSATYLYCPYCRRPQHYPARVRYESFNKQ